MKILCTGDIHIGRRPASVPEGSDPQSWSTGRVFGRLVDFAVREAVDIVAISGDIIDRSNRFFEAFAPLEAGLSRLAAAGIDTVAVAGNHDFDALPRFIDQARPERFTLLGRGGRWESCTISRGGAPRVRFDGWSFPSEHVPDNPLLVYDLPAASAPIIGLLHGDFEQPGSVYAPIRSADLDMGQVACWILGHIHRPGLVRSAMPIAFYPGSPQALHSGETGPHGPWMLDLDFWPLRPEQVPLAAIRFDGVPFDVTGIDSEGEFQARASGAVRAHAETVSPSGGPEHLVCRLQAFGRSGCLSLLRKYAATLVSQENQWDHRGCAIVLERIDLDGVRPLRDLSELARGAGPPAALSRVLQQLEAPEISPDILPLIHASRERMARAAGQPVFSALETRIPTDAEVVATLLRQGYRTLDILLAQKEAP